MACFRKYYDTSKICHYTTYGPCQHFRRSSPYSDVVLTGYKPSGNFDFYTRAEEAEARAKEAVTRAQQLDSEMKRMRTELERLRNLRSDEAPPP